MVKQTSTTGIPSWLRAFIKHDELSEIAAAVRQVEVATSGEVVPMVVRRSIVTGHVFPLVLLSLALVYLAVEVLWAHSSWHGQHWVWSLIEVGFLVPLALALSRLVWVRRLLTTNDDIALQVLRRAESEFYQATLHLTSDSTGILIFVSIEEREAVVLADKGISKLLPPQVWHEVVSLVTQSVRDGGLGKGFTAAIRRCGELLTPHFPIKDHDRNELSDALVIKE